MINTFLYVFCIVLGVILLFLILIYSANKKDHSSYYYGFNCWFTSIMLIDNVLRCFPEARGDGINSKDVNEEVSFICHAQAFLLTLFDKFTILSIAIFAIFSYEDKFHEERFKEKRKALLIILIIIIIIISLICTIIFFTQGISDRSQFCYVETKSDLKKWVDSIVTGFFGFIDFFFTILIFIRNKCCKCDKTPISLVINLITFIYVLFLINRILPFDGYAKDFAYIFLCLISNLFMVINKEVYKYIKKVFHCDKNGENKSDGDNDNLNILSTNVRDNFNDENFNEND
jgi:hypothetical protein